ncbi:hypothetical protein [Methanococcoides sp. LMO-2]|uniref:Uncharacterized protein n=1 Tax=Methanococcoides cohabitans TaxID=3136559 RepID=A0ABU9KV87_9EURY
MGLVNLGVPENEVEYLRDNLNLDVFVEGGTYKGTTAKKMSDKFSLVYTIEKSDAMFSLAEGSLKSINNIFLLKGDTRNHLDKILENNDNILFWLDAHWSGGDTYGENDECPLLEELSIIFSHDKNHIILIDDARLFLAPPPLPHKILNWPSLGDILDIVPTNWDLLIFEDVIYIFPDQNSKHIKAFFQGLVTKRWDEYCRANKSTVLNGLKLAARGMLRGNIY